MLSSSRRNPGAHTIEDEVEEAIFKAGGIDEANHGQLNKARIVKHSYTVLEVIHASFLVLQVGWSRAARTDKGVHAAGQVVSLRLRVPRDAASEAAMLERINASLPADIRAFSLLRTTSSFNSKNACYGRQYEYILPTFCLAPVPERPDAGKPRPVEASSSEVAGTDGTQFAAASNAATDTADAAEDAEGDGEDDDTPSTTAASGPELASNGAPASATSAATATATPVATELRRPAFVAPPADYSFRVSAETHARFAAAIGRYVGTHAYHNFTPRMTCGDAGTLRYMNNVTVSQPFLVRVKVKADAPAPTPAAATATPANASSTSASAGASDDSPAQAPAAAASTVTAAAPADQQQELELEFVRVTIVGQSFLLNQIRHMVGLAADIARGAVPASLMDIAFSHVIMRLPLAPAEGLYLHHCLFTHYDAKFAASHAALTTLPPDGQALQTAFLENVIWPHIAATAAGPTRPFETYLATTDASPGLYRTAIPTHLHKLVGPQQGGGRGRGGGRKGSWRGGGYGSNASKGQHHHHNDPASVSAAADGDGDSAAGTKRGREEMEASSDLDSNEAGHEHSHIYQPVSAANIQGLAVSKVARERQEHKHRMRAARQNGQRDYYRPAGRSAHAAGDGSAPTAMPADAAASGGSVDLKS